MQTAILPHTLLSDAHGRVARDLRVSLTDRCNLRCSYCMPAEGLSWLPGPDVLTDAEVVRLISVAVTRLGVRKLRFTGGEPLLRRGLVDIIAASAPLRTDEDRAPELSLTTNGIGLDKHIDALAAAGLNRVNVSLDSLDRERYAALARRDRLSDVLNGLEAVDAAGLKPVKVNTVAMRGANDIDIVPLAEFCLARGYQLRFIEHMPLGPAHAWDRSSMLPAADILARLRERFDLTPAPARGSAPSEDWLVAAGSDHPAGRIGVIASVTAPVLRRLRPDPAHGRRPDPYLPVQPLGDRPADAVARRGRRRGAGGPVVRRSPRPSPPATASTTWTSTSPPAP